MIDINGVSNLIRDVAQDIIVPRWRALAQDEVIEKAPGDLVTIADREAELYLTNALSRMTPDAQVVGEEAVSLDPSLMNNLERFPALWFVDPIDGTQNFVRGDERYAVMVCMMRAGQTVASWIYLPALDKMVVAEQGGGTWINSVRAQIPKVPTEKHKIVPAAHMKRMPENLRDDFQKKLLEFGTNKPAFCAGYDYMALIEGKRHFLLYNRTLPWDHAPGTLLVTEAGGKAARFTGTDYAPLALNEMGLLVAPEAETWQNIRDTLFAG